eukprot:SAG11_NODE_31816_length_288_cov_8.343915_1_plen_34_part_01
MIFLDMDELLHYEEQINAQRHALGGRRRKRCRAG